MAQPTIKREFSIDVSTGEFSVDPGLYSVRITITFFSPEPRPDHSYACTYQILENGHVIRDFSVLGTDGVNATVRAFRSAAIDVKLRFPTYDAVIPHEYLRDMCYDL